jgi:hypothetical protein
VAGISRAFGWAEDAKLRDSALQNEFMEEHREKVWGALMLLFASFLSDIERAARIRGLRLGPGMEVEKLEGEELKKFLSEEVNGSGIVIKDYKGMNDLLGALRKVVFEFNPTDEKTSGGGQGGPLGGTRVSGDLNVQLIIEK